MHATPIEILATILFAIAVVHTFCVKRFAHWAHRYPSGSIPENALHFLAETEVVFGLWAAALFLGIFAISRSLEQAVHYIEGLNYTEAKFVLVIMVVAATRPVVLLAERILDGLSQWIPATRNVAFFWCALAIGPLLGSFITEPAAMTLLAIVLRRRYFDQKVSSQLAYSALGLLFVNVSIGGTLTHFAAPPVLMVAKTWNWDSWFMMTTFGWRAALSTCLSSLLITLWFRRELDSLEAVECQTVQVPRWLTSLHIAFSGDRRAFCASSGCVFRSLYDVPRADDGHPRVPGPAEAARGPAGWILPCRPCDSGNLQEYWLKPLITELNGPTLFFGAIGLTAITDNAALNVSRLPGRWYWPRYEIRTRRRCGDRRRTDRDRQCPQSCRSEHPPRGVCVRG